MNKKFGSSKKHIKPDIFEISKFFDHFFSNIFKQVISHTYQHYPHIFNLSFGGMKKSMYLCGMKKLTMLEMGRIDAAAFKAADKMPLVIVLDNVRSLNNIGSVFRTSDAFRVEAICLCGISATPPSPEIHKTALGAEDSVAWQYYEDTHDAVRDLQQRGYHVMAIEQCQGSTMLDTWTPDFAHVPGYAVVMGNEVKGVQQTVVDMCDGCLEIPQYGTKHSLNVSVTTGLVIWDFCKSFKKAVGFANDKAN